MSEHTTLEEAGGETLPASSRLGDRLIAALPEPWEINVIGFTGHRTMAPWDDPQPGRELWACNALHLQEGVDWRKCHRWFDPHPRAVIEQDPNHTAWLRSQRDLAVYLLGYWPELCPSGIPLPVDRLTSQLGTTYFTNTISYMIGLAILELQPAARKWRENPSEAPQPTLGVYGVDMAQATEYGAQRPSCELFLGIAMGMGIKVQIPPASDLMKSAGMYAVSDNGELRAKMLHRKNELEAIIEQLTDNRNHVATQLGQIDGQIARHQGHVSELTYWLNVWTMPETKGAREESSLPGQLAPVQTLGEAPTKNELQVAISS